MSTQGSSQYDTDYVTKYEIQTSLDRENWETYKENGTNKVNITTGQESMKLVAVLLFSWCLYLCIQSR